MRLLARVGADVDREGTSLDEGLVTVLPSTSVWAFVGVDAEVSLQVGLPVKTLVAHLPGALEWAGGLLGLHNFEQIHWCSLISGMKVEIIPVKNCRSDSQLWVRPC